MKLSDYGLYDGINEVIGVTMGEWLNTAPIGVIVEGNSATVKLYHSHTRDNLIKGSKLWVNINFDPIIFVISAFEDLGEEYFHMLNPPVVRNTMAWAEFQVMLDGLGRENRLSGEVNTSLAETETKETLAKLYFVRGEIIDIGVRAINRGFNALIEALVHATRYKSSHEEDLKEKILYYGGLIKKCGGEREKSAYKLLLDYAGL